MEFILQPNVYSTGHTTTLLGMLDNMWIRSGIEGEGTIYIVSGFSNYNGGVRFYPFFARHVQKGGKIEAFIGGSTAQKLKAVIQRLAALRFSDAHSHYSGTDSYK